MAASPSPLTPDSFMQQQGASALTPDAFMRQQQQTTPAQPQDSDSWLTRGVTGLGRAIDKTLKQVNVTQVLDTIGKADTLAGEGRWAEAWGALRGLTPEEVLGNPEPFQQQKEYVQDTVNKYRSGDKSGALANVLTATVMNAHAAPEAVDALGRATEQPRAALADMAPQASEAAQTAGTAAKGAAVGAVKGLTDWKRSGGYMTALIPGVGPPLAKTLAAGNALYGAVKGAREALADRTAQRAADTVQTMREQAQPAAEALAVTAGPEGVTPSRDLLDKVAVGLGAKSFADLNDRPALQEVARREATRIAEADAKASAAQTGTDPAVAGSVSQPAGAPVSGQQLARQAVEDARAAGASAPAAQAAASPAGATVATPAATPAGTPASPTAQALVPAPQSAVLQSPAGAPADVATQTSLQPTITSRVATGEYYPAGGPAHIPTPGELGVKDDAMESSTLRHIRAENEKAYNAASFAFKNGVTPDELGNMTEDEKRDFMNGTKDEPGALQHGREVGNPTPKNKYGVDSESGSVFDRFTLRLAKAHLQKMIDNGGPEEPEGQPALPAPERAAQTVERLRKQHSQPAP